MGRRLLLSKLIFPSVWLLTLAGLAVAAEAESRATAASSGLVAVAQQTDIRATPGLPKLIQGTSMAAYYARREGHKYNCHAIVSPINGRHNIID